MVFHRFRGSDALGDGLSRSQGIADQGPPLHVRMMRLPRTFNLMTGFGLGAVLVLLYIVYDMRALRAQLASQQETVLEHLGQLSSVTSALAGSQHNGDHVDYTHTDGYLRTDQRPPTLWLISKTVHHLNHVMTVFTRCGYQIMRKPVPHFDVIWSYDYPFNTGWKQHILNMRGPQKINHFPGSGYITNKMSLSTSKLKHLPTSYRIPGDVAALQTDASENPDKLWVMKSNDHRGIKIRKITDMDLTATGSLNFVQEFVANPLLIDGRKFDIGVYVAIASFNPLRVYMYDEEVLLRFCTEDYVPLDVSRVEKYVIGDKYTPTRQIPSLKESIVDRQYSMMQTLNVYLKSKGFDPEKLWAQVRTSISEVTLAKEGDIKGAMSTYPDPSIFFEMVRFDFVVDDQLSLWLMEVNMSPNLSSSMHPENGIMYEQVIYNTLALVGVARHISGPVSKLSEDDKKMLVRNSDVEVPVDECHTDQCKTCNGEICSLCHHCMSSQQRQIFQQAFLEHDHRRNFRRVFPVPPSDNDFSEVDLGALSSPNKIMRMWYSAKCKHSPHWCN